MSDEATQLPLDRTDDPACEVPHSPAAAALKPSLSGCINYASWQNSVPFLRSLEVENLSGELLSELQLELVTKPAFARPKRWMIQAIHSGSSVSISDRDIELDPDYLSGLNEAERGQVSLRLLQGSREIAEHTENVRVLARDEWGGMASMGELLAAFVMPNDPAVARILKSAADVLSSHGHSAALDGYQSKDPRRAYLLVAAIWSAVAAENLTYANPPRSFERVGQKVRRPATVLRDGLATCLDSTVLFAAAIEAVGLNPIVVLQDGHCFTGVWLIDTTFGTPLESNCSEVRKAIAGKDLITFETTLITHQPPARFEDAVKAAERSTRESQEDKFVAALDITRARFAQIRPLASHDGGNTAAEGPVVAGGPLPLSPPPDFGDIAPEKSEEKPTTANGRIDRWQRKLLDLSLRNRLLNFTENKQSIPFLCPDVPFLEDRLSAGANLRLVSLAEQNPLGDRDAALHRQKNHQDLHTEFATSALQRDEVTSPLDANELQSRLTTLYRRVKNDLSEGGSNTLFLAVGFLRWKQKPGDERSYRAPLLLVPVKLTRKSALSPFRLAHHEDDVRFNATLIQLLKKDFGRDLSQFESDLPVDASGVDVPLVLERMRREVRDIPGFEVVDETALSTFSFAKYLMWKDLVDRIDQLEQNRVVRHLIRDPDKPFQSGTSTTIPQAHEADVRYAAKELIHPLQADSSQLAAVMAAAEGQDFVLVGPPGTGKSQTIANMIAQCLANKKTVLFVAEKTAALDVVYRRLRENGLGDFCLELHSNKAERRKFLDQMQHAWDKGRKPADDDWLSVSNRLQIRRDELNSYVIALHAQDPSGWTVYRAMGVSVQGKGRHCPEFKWPKTLRHDTAAYQSMARLVGELGLTFGAIDPEAPLPWIKMTEWSAGWEANLLRRCDAVAAASLALRSSLEDFARALGIASKQDASLAELDKFSRLGRALLATADADYRIIFNKQFAKLPAQLDQLEVGITKFNAARGKTAAVYVEEELKRIPIHDLDAEWRQAQAKFWPMSYFAKRRVQRLLQSYAGEGAAVPETDIPLIKLMQEQLAQIDASELAGQTHHWRQQHTDTAAFRQHLAKAAEARKSVMDLGQELGNLSALSKTIAPVLTGTSTNHAILDGARSFLTALEQFLAEVRAFTDVAGSTPMDRQSTTIAGDLADAAHAIQANRRELQRWTAWCDVKEKAVACGLDVFVAELESGQIASADLQATFELAYVRWWLPGAIDRSDVLRNFQKFKHEDAIQDFRKLDDLARSSASARVRTAIAHQLPSPEKVPRRSELGLLRHQIGLKRPSRSIREMISGMPDNFGQLAPCILMSPLSIAQYLPAEQALFDVVIFDEASQITTWDAIGAIARGRQTIIVGDPKQLPPTNFFGRSDNDEDNDELQDHERDLESILDEAKASGLPTLQLNWHYRSRHESLIAFSNWHYYGNQLVTFPSAVTDDRAVSLKHLPHASYDRGKSRTNRKEAEAIVADAVARMKQWLTLPEHQRQTLGVITFNSQQQSLIQDLFDQAQRDNPELDWFFSDDRIEPTVVKNLENVQGDERDVMFFSVTFGFNAAGKVPLNFGALNRDGGERRLNVAVTRSRGELVVYSSFKAEHLAVEGTKACGVRHLKNFLDYAERGPIALAAETAGSVGGFDSPFEEAVADALVKKGWQAVPQVGVSGFRVDLGIVHPEKPGVYLAGIECDGATYHRSATARDRDKTREQVLRNLGWEIIRIWSPDWWYDSEGAIAKVDKALEDLLEKGRESRVAAGEQETDAVQRPTQIQNLIDDSAPENADDGASKTIFCRVSFESYSIDPDAFFEDHYSGTLNAMVQEVIQVESPIRDDVLAKRIARAHGFQRTGARIRNRVLACVKDAQETIESTGRFLWAADATKDVIEYRYPQSDDDRRSVDEISMAELCGVVHEHRSLLEEEDPAVAIARAIGVSRLAGTSRARLEEAIERIQCGDADVARLRPDRS